MWTGYLREGREGRGESSLDASILLLVIIDISPIDQKQIEPTFREYTGTIIMGK